MLAIGQGNYGGGGSVSARLSSDSFLSKAMAEAHCLWGLTADPEVSVGEWSEASPVRIQVGRIINGGAKL